MAKAIEFGSKSGRSSSTWGSRRGKKTKVERKCEIIICMKGENDEVSALIPNKKMNEDQNSQRSA